MRHLLRVYGYWVNHIFFFVCLSFVSCCCNDGSSVVLRPRKKYLCDDENLFKVNPYCLKTSWTQWHPILSFLYRRTRTLSLCLVHLPRVTQLCNLSFALATLSPSGTLANCFSSPGISLLSCQSLADALKVLIRCFKIRWRGEFPLMEEGEGDG